MLHPRCSVTAAFVARAGAFSICLALVACKKAPTGFHAALGDATVYELVSRKWEKIDPPARKLVLHADGTAAVTIEDDTVKVVLAADGNITVVDRPDGNKWRIEAKDPAVMRTAFRLLGTSMKTALD